MLLNSFFFVWRNAGIFFAVLHMGLYYFNGNCISYFFLNLQLNSWNDFPQSSVFCYICHFSSKIRLKTSTKTSLPTVVVVFWPRVSFFFWLFIHIYRALECLVSKTKKKNLFSLFKQRKDFFSTYLQTCLISNEN